MRCTREDGQHAQQATYPLLHDLLRFDKPNIRSLIRAWTHCGVATRPIYRRKNASESE